MHFFSGIDILMYVCFAVEEAISREIALRRLLQMVELNVLDSILSYDPVSSCQALRHQKKDMGFSNLAFKRNESLASVYEDRCVSTLI